MNPNSAIVPAGLRRRQRVRLQNPTETTPDGDGGYTQTWTDCTPATVYARVQMNAPGNQEHAIDGTIAAAAAFVVTIPYHGQVSTLTRVFLISSSRMLSVLGVANLDEANRQLVLTCAELEGAPAIPTTSGDWVAEGWH